EHALLVVVVLDEVVEPLAQRVEEHRVLVDMLEEEGARGLTVLVELDLAVRAVEVEHRVERVVVHLGLLLEGGHAVLRDCRCQNCLNPSRTRVTSSFVPRSSKPYRYGTSHLAEMIFPARQYASPKLVLPAAMT